MLMVSPVAPYNDYGED